MSFESIPELLADILNEQRNTTAAIVSLAEAIANAGKSRAIETQKAKKSVDSLVESATDVAASATEYAKQKGITDEPDLDYEEVSRLTMSAMKTSGRASVVALLKSFGADKLPNLDPAKYREFIDGLTALEVA